MSSSKPPLILIAGPTASGKSALALALAQQIHGVIVNADSAQVYKDLRILSASPDEAELAAAEHRLYGFADGAPPLSAAEWAELARREIAEIHSDQRTPILVGGTGLYIRTLLEGIAPVPPIDPDLRADIRSSPVAVNRQRLEELDPEAAARIGIADAARINRALEVIVSTGRPLAHWQRELVGGLESMVELRAIILQPPRELLYAACDARFAGMVENGALEEVRQLLERGLNPQLPVMRAIGVRELASHLAGAASLDESIEAGQQATRRYAKRQYTWFAHQPPANWPRLFEPLQQETLDRALALLAARA